MRLLSLQPSISIILDRLGRLDQLCACTKYCLEVVPALAAQNLPIVQDSWSTRTEELLPLRPDLVLASVPYRQESLTAILKSGIPVLLLAPHSLADIYNDIRLIASVANAATQAKSLIAEMQSAVESVRARTASLPRARVYCEEWGKPLIHSQLWVRELIEAAGGEFIGTPGSTTTPEAVAAADPDVILAAWCGAGNRVPIERIVEQRDWRTLRAVRNQNVFCIRDEWLNTPAPTLLRGLQAIAAALHPGVFDPPEPPDDLRRIRML
ncbi:MAG: ABC transporter substrate-binding protein [Acidobacteriaceae bacterium]